VKAVIPLTLTLAMLMVSTAAAAVSVQVYRADEATPLEWADPNIADVFRDIMVGTRLALFFISDTEEIMWSGGIQISWDDWARGTVTGRGYNEITRNYDGSILPALSKDTFICDSPGSNAMHISLGIDTGLVGEWIVLDYQAQALGTCSMGVYAVEAGGVSPGFNPMLDDPPPARNVWIQALSFNHVPSRDYSGDAIVNFTDFAVWAARCHEPIVLDPNSTTPEEDLNGDDIVDGTDLALFCEYWLERTDLPETVEDPNALNVSDESSGL
jgi:hypothetical protein